MLIIIIYIYMGIGDYLEIKQDADEFLEKLNKKKNDTKNKFNKYSTY